MERDAETKPYLPPPENDRALLRRRARELARAIETDDGEERIGIVEFRLGRERLAFESVWVQEVFRPREVVRIPGAPPFIAGLVNLRGIVHSVVDLAQVLGLPGDTGGAGMVLLLANDGMSFGVLAERVETARQVPRREVNPPLPTLSPAALRYLRGVLPGAVSLLDARRLLDAPHLLVNQRDDTDYREKGVP